MPLRPQFRLGQAEGEEGVLVGEGVVEVLHPLRQEDVEDAREDGVSNFHVVDDLKETVWKG